MQPSKPDFLEVRWWRGEPAIHKVDGTNQKSKKVISASTDNVVFRCLSKRLLCTPNTVSCVHIRLEWPSLNKRLFQVLWDVSLGIQCLNDGWHYGPLKLSSNEYLLLSGNDLVPQGHSMIRMYRINPLHIIKSAGFILSMIIIRACTIVHEKLFFPNLFLSIRGG
jgi:hypothetical protein